MRHFGQLTSCIIKLFAAVTLAGTAIISAYGQPHFWDPIMQKIPLGPNNTDKGHIGDLITVRIRVRNLDDFNDSLTITSIVDILKHATVTNITPNLLPAPVVLTNFGDFIITTNAYLILPED